MRGRSAAKRPIAQNAPEPMDLPPSAAARRLGTPRWLDVRMILGMVLVLGCVLVGARVIAAADESTTVWALQHDLAPGSLLQSDDLKKVQVRLYANADTYLSGASSPAGRVLNRAVSAGELLPKSALASRSAYVTLALSVPAQRVPTALAHGQAINVYATQPESAGSQSTGSGSSQPVVTLVAEAVAVAAVSGRGSGALTVSTSALQVSVKVPACRVEELIAGTEGKMLSIVVLESTPAAKEDPC